MLKVSYFRILQLPADAAAALDAFSDAPRSDSSRLVTRESKREGRRPPVNSHETLIAPYDPTATCFGSVRAIPRPASSILIDSSVLFFNPPQQHKVRLHRGQSS